MGMIYDTIKKMFTVFRFLFMRQNLKYTLPSLVVVALVVVGFQWTPGDDTKESIVLRLVADALTQVHYQPRELDDQLSSLAFDAFIDDLDGDKRFFTAQDIEEFRLHRWELDNEIKVGSTAFFELVYGRFETRRKEAQERYQRLLSSPVAIQTPTDFETNAEKRVYPLDDAAMENFWKQYLSFRVVARMVDRMNDKDSGQVIVPGTAAFDAAETSARAKEREVHDEWFKALSDMDRSEWFGVYVNSFTAAFDPHTEYFAPRLKEDFEIEMTGQLEGIGASLGQKGEYVYVASIVVGSACWKQGELEEGDKLVKVAQGNAEPVDVVGLPSNKVVRLVRGKKGTEVRLTVKKKDGTVTTISIVRDIVEIEATFARSAMIGPDGKTGYIRLPKFYVDFFKDRNHNCAADVRAEIEKLKKQGMQRLVFDLRGNGGGSLPAAVDVAGLFIHLGPVVQVKTSGQQVRIYNDKASDVAWEGPLVVMVNEGTASASEIVAAALQDYKRALIIGSKQTFGKGTVQNVIDMDEVVSGAASQFKPLGGLKITIQKFYRVTGQTTQLQGVASDVVLPHAYQYLPIGESEMKFPLAADQIVPAKIVPVGMGQFHRAVKKSAERVTKSPAFGRINEYALWLKSEKEKSILRVDFLGYEAFEKGRLANGKRFEKLGELPDSMNVRPLPSVALEMTAYPAKNKEWTHWLRALSHDVYLREAVSVASDL